MGEASVLHLADYLERAAARFPDRPAVFGPDGECFSYRQLDQCATNIAAFLAERNVGVGARVGLVLPKGIPLVCAIFGVLKAGAAYVPVDLGAPAERVRTILEDCGVEAVFVHAASLAALWPDPASRPTTVVAVPTGGDGLEREGEASGITSWRTATCDRAVAPRVARRGSSLAYILYTSGSTGVPKGVMLTHENATSFLDWCSETFAPDETDRFASHAPFHFDLSVLDVFLCVKHGASLHLISEALGQNPRALAQFISQRALTVWYSTPSILSLLVNFGSLEKYSTCLRLVLFAGEVFPVKHLRRLVELWPLPAYYNLYGPTETNVCTFARIPKVVPADRTDPYPIGHACSHCSAIVLDEAREEVPPGAEGLLWIAGPSVFGGYWNRAEQSSARLIDRNGRLWYDTGDVVRWTSDGYTYVGRRDRMVKRRGYRIELDDIEAGLHRHERLRGVAVIALPNADAGVTIVAFVVARAAPAPTIVELKQHSATHLPAYMTPDRFLFLDDLPSTSTGKTDYQSLARKALSGD